MEKPRNVRKWRVSWTERVEVEVAAAHSAEAFERAADMFDHERAMGPGPTIEIREVRG